MKLKRIRINEIEREKVKLTDFFRNTPPSEMSEAECEDLREFKSATTTAYDVRKEKRADGYTVKVSLDSIAQTVTVSLTK